MQSRRWKISAFGSLSATTSDTLTCTPPLYWLSLPLTLATAPSFTTPTKRAASSWRRRRATEGELASLSHSTQGTQPVPSSTTKRRSLSGLRWHSVTVPRVSTSERGIPLRENDVASGECEGNCVNERRSKARSLTCVFWSATALFFAFSIFFNFPSFSFSFSLSALKIYTNNTSFLNTLSCYMRIWLLKLIK